MKPTADMRSCQMCAYLCCSCASASCTAPPRALSSAMPLFAIEPRLLELFSVYDSNVGKFFVGSRVVPCDSCHARDCIIAALARYVGLSTEQRPGAAWIVLAGEEALRSVGRDDQQIAATTRPRLLCVSRLRVMTTTVPDFACSLPYILTRKCTHSPIHTCTCRA